MEKIAFKPRAKEKGLWMMREEIQVTEGVRGESGMG